MKRQPLPFLLALLFLSGANHSSAETTPPDYSSWYQIEIIAFANRNAATDDETWLPGETRYPRQMLTVGGDPKPARLAHLAELMAYRDLMDGKIDPVAEDTNPMDFLFEDRSRSNRNPMLARNQEQGGVDPEQAEGEASDLDLDALFNPGLPLPFVEVPAEERLLTRIAASINRSSRYRMLLHSSWRQPVNAAGENWPILVQAGERYDDLFELDGTITISRARFLHAEVNLWFTLFAQTFDQAAPLPEVVSEIDPSMLRAFPELVEVERRRGNYIPVHTHSMQTSRRMRSATLHYVDHPLFGLVIQIDQFNYTPPAP